MNPIDLRILFMDGTETTVTAVAADLIAFESKFDISVAKLSGDEPRLTHLFFLAWHAHKRSGDTKDEFEKWVESVSLVTGVEAKK
jgi:hypothetical protein